MSHIGSPEMIQNGPIQCISASIHSIASSESMEWTYFERLNGWNIGSRHLLRYELGNEFPSILCLFVKGLCLSPTPLNNAYHSHHHHHCSLWVGLRAYEVAMASRFVPALYKDYIPECKD